MYTLRGIPFPSQSRTVSRCFRPTNSLKPFASPSIEISRNFATYAGDLKFGQPLHETHPHLLASGELTPGISAFEYAERRMKLAAALPPNSIAILAAADLKYRSGPVFYRFHQEPNFYYLTGFNEPEAFAIIERGWGTDHVFHLYVRPKDPVTEAWEGSRSGIQAAQDVFNADEAGDIAGVLSSLSNLVQGADHVFSDIPMRSKERSTFNRILFGGRSKTQNLGELLHKSNVKPLAPFMNNLRIFKSDAEIDNLRKAGRWSGRAYQDAMRRGWRTEFELQNFLEYAFKTNGCEDSAYVPVVAGGERANQIHYVRNDDVLQDGQLVCVDAGGEYGNYITDITRTWPVSGKFTDAQRDMYQMILNVQRSCVSMCREDANVSLDRLHQIAHERMSEGLVQLGFEINESRMRTLFPHHLGHYVGLSVHDAPGYSRGGTLKTGQCITIEPGIYVENDERWPAAFRGMGIRIEDSICIGDDGPIVLTPEAPKEIVDIEALRR